MTRFSRFIAAAGATALLALGAVGTAQARDNVSFSVGLHAPGISVGVGNAPYYVQPGYVAPAPVYYAPPRPYYRPPVAYYPPQPVYYEPRPVYYQPRPVYVAPQPVYVHPHPGWRGHRGHGYGHGRGYGNPHEYNY